MNVVMKFQASRPSSVAAEPSLFQTWLKNTPRKKTKKKQLILVKSSKEHLVGGINLNIARLSIFMQLLMSAVHAKLCVLTKGLAYACNHQVLKCCHDCKPKHCKMIVIVNQTIAK